MTESVEEEKPANKDVVANHFDSNQEEPLEEKDFLAEFFAELESEEKEK